MGIILFGSYATGDFTKKSDIDICIVNPKDNNYYFEIEANPLDSLIETNRRFVDSRNYVSSNLQNPEGVLSSIEKIRGKIRFKNFRGAPTIYSN